MKFSTRSTRSTVSPQPMITREHRSIKGNEQHIEDLVIAAQKGEVEAYAAVYDFFVTPIYRYIYYRAPRTDAEDLTELVFLKAWEHIKTYRTQQNRFSSWLFRIAHNVVRDFHRVARTPEELKYDLPDERREADTTDGAHRSFTRDALRQAISRLKENYQQILILKFIDDLSNGEIAQIMEKSEATLRILQFRALRALREELKQTGITEF